MTIQSEKFHACQKFRYFTPFKGEHLRFLEIEHWLLPFSADFFQISKFFEEKLRNQSLYPVQLIFIRLKVPFHR